MKYLIILFTMLMLTMTNMQKQDRPVSEKENVQPRTEQTAFRRLGEIGDLQKTNLYRHRVMHSFGEDDRGF